MSLRTTSLRTTKAEFVSTNSKCIAISVWQTHICDPILSLLYPYPAHLFSSIFERIPTTIFNTVASICSAVINYQTVIYLSTEIAACFKAHNSGLFRPFSDPHFERIVVRLFCVRLFFKQKSSTLKFKPQAYAVHA